MSKRPLFSSYSQGENRVTGSIIAVFERLDLSTLQAVLVAATQDSEIEFVTFDVVRPGKGGGTVPDGTIAARFTYLFEVKTAYDAVRENQLRGHLDLLSGADDVDERLFVLTPDPSEPTAIANLADPRVRWFGFSDLNSGIADVLATTDVPQDERFLLRELQALFQQEGLLGRQDTVIVAAGKAHDFYLRHAAYVCQSKRPFRDGLVRLGFYRKRRIEREFPKIVAVRDEVPFTHDEVARRRAAGEEHLSNVIEETLATGERVKGQEYKVFLLTGANDPDTFTLKAPITHSDGFAWTMGQRYELFRLLEQQPETTHQLANLAIRS